MVNSVYTIRKIEKKAIYNIMNTAFIFDVDGTLTPSRGLMDSDFSKWFLEFNSNNNVYLATGSDAPKTIEQIGETVFNSVKRVYNCSGNSVWEQGSNVYNNEWKLARLPWQFLETKLIHHKFEPKTGKHFDERPGLLNYSIVGRNATTEQRKKYVEYDLANNDRFDIAKEFNNNFSKEYNVVAQVAGETGLDIMPIGKGKQQVLNDFSNDSKIIFFGDRCEPGGNDYDIATAVRELKNGKVFHVKNWQHTWKILQDSD